MSVNPDMLPSMISKVEALGFGCLKFASQPLDRFHVLVGPNSSGKSTLLDVISFLGDLVSEGLETAVTSRSRNFQDLVWKQYEGKGFQLAIEIKIPGELKSQLPTDFDFFRYEVAIGVNSETEGIEITAEKGLLRKSTSQKIRQSSLFPMESEAPHTILTSTRQSGIRTAFNKVRQGNDNFYSEVYGRGGRGWVPTFKLGPRKSTLANLPEDESKFPVSTWIKSLLGSGVRKLVLNSQTIRLASPPGQQQELSMDGSNLPWVANRLYVKHPDRFQDWIDHLRSALPDLTSVKTVERPDDKHRYLVLCYPGNLEVPSWMASDGTLRLLALTLLAYTPEVTGVYLIEEAENGIHPTAVDTMFQSLSSVYGAQILVATHSPVVISEAKLEQVICFSKNAEGSTDIVTGKNHPKLRDWKGEENLSVLFAAGVLG